MGSIRERFMSSNRLCRMSNVARAVWLLITCHWYLDHPNHVKRYTYSLTYSGPVDSYALANVNFKEMWNVEVSS